MLELIRPAMLLTVRLGLFLSAMLWFSGQYWRGAVQVPVGTWRLSAAFGKTTQGISAIRLPASWRFTLSGHSDDSELNEWLPDSRVQRFNEMIAFAYAHQQSYEVVRVPGLTVWAGAHPALLIRHWLVVSVFVLLNGLAWRMRRAKQATGTGSAIPQR